MSFKILLVLFFFVHHVSCEKYDACNFRTCGECISTALDTCVWCSEDDMDGRRCMPLNEVNSTNIWCGGSYIKPQPPNKTVLINNQFNGTVQLKPQRIKIKTRPGLNNTFPIYFEPAEDYPLDIYYLIDISYTMRKQVKELENQAEQIYNQMKGFTNNVRLGIGSFVEKPGFPLVDVYRKDPHISHSFKNHLSLTDNMTNFINIMGDLKFGGNFDDPEAGLDALMQTMVCQKELGWREGARRIIVLSTDSAYHSAGDGKIVGAIKPNDMQCHLEGNLYNAALALTYDYPSISQIDKIAREGNFLIVFACTKSVRQEYESLAKSIRASEYAILESGQEALKIIKDAYLKRSRRAELYYDLPSFVQLTVDQNCTEPTRNCKSTSVQRNVTIEGNLSVDNCPLDKIFKRELIVHVVSIQDKLTIELEIDCQCDCEKGNSTVTNSDKCHDAGHIQCGICKCNPDRHGVDCRCNGTSSETTDIEKCRRTTDDKKLCSGKGTCRCGVCEECHNGFSGDYCEFDDTACPIQNKMLCSNNGKCTRGQCQCNSRWSGNDCSCPLDDKIACITPFSKKECSGHGKCICGACKCNETYTGRYCDVCDDCGMSLCKDLEEYVLCNFIKNKALCDQQYNTTDTLIYFINTTQMHGPEWNIAQYCMKQLENDSRIIFKYKYDDGKMLLGIRKELELPPKANIYIAVGAGLGAVLLIGIITLVAWKILIDMHDKKEYAKFAKESNAQGCEVFDNVLYTPPHSTFNNPAFDNK